MRAKRRTRRRVGPDGRAAVDEVRMADWVLANEAGWGLPHGGVVLLAGIVVGAGAAVGLIERIAAAVGRASRQRWH